MHQTYDTNRLSIARLCPGDAEFVKELVNTPGWLKFIGDRKVHNLEDAHAYIQKIMNSPNINYWVVRLKDEGTCIGIVTFIKREYLDHHDIGFAFLPPYFKKGYAYEAAHAILEDAILDNHPKIVATTIKGNENSVKLLAKLGLSFEKEMELGNEILNIYSVTADKVMINAITKTFFSLFTNTNNNIPNLEAIHQICLPGAVIMKQENKSVQVYDLDSFIRPRQAILIDGTLTDFEEYEVEEDTRIINHIAQRFSRYQKSGFLNGQRFEARGAKLFQYAKNHEGWKISAVIWEDEKE
jgi:RimJ/RimL family protein N-acetyltransferase